jgi:hypothetical protein
MRMRSVAALIGAGAVLAGGAALAATSDRPAVGAPANVYFQALSPAGQAALRKLCAAAGGQVVANAKGQLGCQVGSLNDSKNISDGAAKGQASE